MVAAQTIFKLVIAAIAAIKVAGPGTYHPVQVVYGVGLWILPHIVACLLQATHHNLRRRRRLKICYGMTYSI